jgi:cell division protein FtsI/penicillin-binding protein 2
MASVSGIRFERRATLLAGLLGFGFLLLLLRQGQLQFAEGDQYREAVEKRRTKTIELPAKAGKIRDRSGRVLADSVEAYELYFYPVRFRESNRIDALHDLAVALFPEQVKWIEATPPSNRAESRSARLQRFLGAWENRESIAAALLASPVEALEVPVKDLAHRWGPFLFPRGELVIPPNARLRRRLIDCLVIIADDPALARRAAVRERLDEGGTIGEALDLDARRLVAAIEEQYSELDWLASETDRLDLDAFLYLMFEREETDRRRLVDRIDAVIDDRIALDRIGTHALGDLDADELARIASSLGLPSDDDEVLWDGLVSMRHQVAEGSVPSDPELMSLLTLFAEVQSLDDLEERERFERRALADRLGLWTRDGRAIKRALGARVRQEADFDEASYLSTHRKWNRIQHFKGGMAWRLGAGWSFETADRVWRLSGLEAAGFEVRANWRRRYWRDEEGFASLLIGRRLIGEGVVGGLERSAAIRAPDAKEPPAFVGRAGRLKRRHGLDGRWEETGESLPPKHGEDLRLSFDRELQYDAEQLIARVARDSASSLGAALCVLDIQTGEIVALASGPNADSQRLRTLVRERGQIDRDRGAARLAYRQGEFSGEELASHLQKLQERVEDSRLWDPAFKSDDMLSPPGSVLKVFSAAAFLEELAPRGAFDPNEVMLTSDKGPVDLHEALYLSSNDYFREHVKKLDHATLIDWFEGLGLFQPTPFLVGSSSGRRRSEAVRKRRQANNDVIGQGTISTSPLEVASMMATLSRRGLWIEPTLVLDRGTPARKREVEISEKTWSRLAEAMAAVARHYDPQGAEEVDLGGKTGTADGFTGTRWSLHNQAWFAGVFPMSAPRYAFAMTTLRTRWRGKQLVPYCVELAKLVLEMEPPR